jgi:MoaA/NifB/PqqE/SkfB family radical SAM enzyme
MMRLRSLLGWNRDRRAALPVDEVALAAPFACRGSVEAVSAEHVEGWIQSLADPDARVEYEVVLPATGEVLARGRADQFRHGQYAAGIGDGAHGFLARLPRALSGAECGKLAVRACGTGAPLPRSPALRTAFEPVLHVAMDIVDNCNLRCPFCLFDYSRTRTTNFMTEETVDAALRFLPYVRDGQFWFSCLHEPTLHPRLMAYVDKIPAVYRRKVFYTSNLAKRMPPAYFAWLADTGLHNINISIESTRPELYERMREGARWRIFKENWDALLAAARDGKAPPRLRYIVMAYKSNAAELPDLARYLIEERQAWMVELRYTFDVPHIPAEFRAAEFLDADEWLGLRDRLAAVPQDRVSVEMPPTIVSPGAAAVPASDAILPDYYMFRMSWDGSFRVVGVLADSRGGNGIETDLFTANVRDIADPHAFLDGIARHGRR